MKKKEQGFVLVTSLVLLSILTLMGITSSYKTVMQIKISKMSQDMDRAGAAANTGLTQLYWYWSADGSAKAGGIKEFNDVISFFTGGNVVPSIYQGALTPNSVATAPSDVTIQASTSIRVFTLNATGIVLDKNANWGKTSDPQMAVWVTAFDETLPPAYPYAKPIDLTKVAGCPSGCRMVTYSLGRSGKSRRLVRETQSVIEGKLTGVSAMTNAPAGDDFAELCNPGAGSNTGANGSGTNWDPTVNGGGGNGTALIEATQAPYALGSVPSGTALASNTGLGTGGKGFRKGTSSTTGSNFSSVPYILYAGHGAKNGFKIDWADTMQDTAKADLPAGKLPTKLVNAPLAGTPEAVNYFSDPNAQLFSMDHYRWAAEQFTCQDITQPDGQFGNGIYCSKAEALRKSVDAIMSANSGGAVRAFAPVTGRLTIAQIQYNIAYGIPMFGMIRLMFPAVIDPGVSAVCNGIATQLHVIESGGDSPLGNWDFNKLMDGGTYTGGMSDPTGVGYSFVPQDTNGDGVWQAGESGIPDDDGRLGPNARLVVYGTLLFEYFADYDIQGVGTTSTNTVFEPFAGERLLSPLESPDVYLAIEHNNMINPVMPRFAGNVPLPFPTAASAIKPSVLPAGSPSALNNPAPALASAAAADLDVANTMNMVDLNDLANARLNNRVNLASPYDGLFPVSEGMLPLIGPSNAGTMRLMSRATVADNPSNLGLVQMAQNIGVGTEITAPTADMVTLMSMAKPGAGGTEAQVLHYYYDLLKTTLNPAVNNDWPIAPWPGDALASPFCIGAQDCGTTDPYATTWLNNMGDKVHLLFPTGYIHAWKVALAALDVTGDEWNHVLSGSELAGNQRQGIASATGLYQQISNACDQDGTGATPNAVGFCRMGRPFNNVDQGFTSLAVVQDIQSTESDYFNVTVDQQTGYGLLDASWRDIPSTMYSGGLLDMHAHSNMTGIVYTPGPLEWEPGNSNYDSGVHLSYINGAIITGYGASSKNKGADDRYVLVFDSQAVDNVNTNSKVIALRRYDWQMLR